MTTIKGHFDGSTVVLDEPAALRAGQLVRVVVIEDVVAETDVARPSLRGIAKGTFVMRDDFDEPLDEFAEYRQ